MISRIFRWILSGMLAMAMALPCSAGPKEDAQAAVELWAAAFNASDVERIVASYTPDALVLGTVSPSLASTPDDLRKYFGASSAAKSQVRLGESSAIVLSNDAVALAGFYEFSRVVGGQPVVAPARFTFVVVRRDGVWHIAHHHSSLRPKPAQ